MCQTFREDIMFITTLKCMNETHKILCMSKELGTAKEGSLVVQILPQKGSAAFHYQRHSGDFPVLKLVASLVWPTLRSKAHPQGAPGVPIKGQMCPKALSHAL